MASKGGLSVMKTTGGLSVVKTTTTKPTALKGSLPKSASVGGGLSVVKNQKPQVSEADQIKVDVETWMNGEAYYLESAERLSKVDQLLSSYKNKMAVAKLVALAKFYSLSSAEGLKILASLAPQMQDMDLDPSKVDVPMRENSLMLMTALLKAFGKAMEPYVVVAFPSLLFFHCDKNATVRDLSATLCSEFAKIAGPHAFRIIYPPIIKAIGKTWNNGNDIDWRVKVGSLTFLQMLAPRVSRYISPLLSELIPTVSECIYDSKKQVQTAGIECLTEACKSITNDDIRGSVPQLVSVIARPDEAPKALDKLLETTFVANVDAPVLSLIAPLLGKVLKGRSSIMKRKAAKVIDIMCRLVQEPSDVAPFMPLLMPQLEKVIDEIVDTEVCGVAKEAREVLLQAMGDGHERASDPTILAEKDLPLMQAKLAQALMEVLPEEIKTLPITKHIADVASMLTIYDNEPNPNRGEEAKKEDAADRSWRVGVAMTPMNEWRECVVPYLLGYFANTDKDLTDKAEMEALSIAKAEEISAAFRKLALGDVPDNNVDDDDDGNNLCNIEFSLAFGGKILLHNARLKLGKGRRYGLMGKNGAGKTTLLTNIGSGNIEGLPPHLRMIYVQHDDRSEDHGLSLLDELADSKDMQESKVTKAACRAALEAIFFTEDMLTSPRSNLSGGWKMKLLIIKAMLANADVLLLDEPTNHLDAASVKWLIDFILSQDATCLIVSHDTMFMDSVLTDVIHYETKKLVYYPGNLTNFVQVHPEAKYYYELKSDLTFKFPNPERLDGIASSTRSILKMDNITYTYPGAKEPQLHDVSVKVCLASRVAILGANGAGKSTLIKLLVQETLPDPGSGVVWKHMNLRIAYVAQHSFHHIEQHVDSSPVDYMKWRFAGGVDREDMAKANTKLTEEEIYIQQTEKKYGDIVDILGRRKNGRTMEYECTFVGQTKRDLNKYIAVEELIERGYSKLVQQCDAKVAAMAAGLAIRPLLIAEIQGHLDEFNLEAEFGTHGTIKRLSGGQKVKLVLAAAMWNRPHVIVLDEPTNYLDREALGALSQAIKGFGGAVVIISHNKEFTDELCTENWFVRDGKCFVEGDAVETAIKVTSEKSIKAGLKKSQSAPDSLDAAGMEKEQKSSGGNTNKTIAAELIMNPRSLEPLSKKEIRKLEKVAQVAGLSLKDYVLNISCKSPEWKWL